jgi:hypothetical protein
MDGELVLPKNRQRLAEAAREAFNEERYINAYLDAYRELTGL